MRFYSGTSGLLACGAARMRGIPRARSIIPEPSSHAVPRMRAGTTRLCLSDAILRISLYMSRVEAQISRKNPSDLSTLPDGCRHEAHQGQIARSSSFPLLRVQTIFNLRDV